MLETSELLRLLPRLRRFARALARTAADADDLVQTALERALRRQAQFEPGTRLDAWLFRILRNAWIDETRSRRRRDEVFTSEEAAGQVGVEGASAALADASALHDALQSLPIEQREAIVLVCVEGFTYEEAATVLAVPVGTITSRVARGRTALLARLK